MAHQAPFSTKHHFDPLCFESEKPNYRSGQNEASSWSLEYITNSYINTCWLSKELEKMENEDSNSNVRVKVEKGMATHGGSYVEYNVMGNLFHLSFKYTPPIQLLGCGSYGIVWFVILSLSYISIYMYRYIVCSLVFKYKSSQSTDYILNESQVCFDDHFIFILIFLVIVDFFLVQ